VSAVPCTVKRNNYQWIQSALSGSLHLSGVNLISHGNNHVLLGAESPGFKNETIPLADLAGSARAYPEADQGYPIGYVGFFWKLVNAPDLTVRGDAFV
jgi:hypothetical protein